MRASKHLRSLATKLAARLPRLPQPWDVEILCRDLALARGRPLTVHAVDLPAFPFGMWYDDGERDRILYRSSATGYHRDHIILHEICHLLAGHGTPVAEGGRTFSKVEEELAELFASLVLRAARRPRPEERSAVERRAEELFGATSA